MLAPDSRTVLLDALRPPFGFGLGFAVATTFTLDLTAALVAPMAFARSDVGDSRDPIAIMEAVRACADRVALFCQAGSIVVPHQPSELVEFVDHMIHQVRRPRPGHLFHPKIWALRFDGEDGSVRYRVLVLTRNLTFDRSWDLALRLDDRAVGKRNANNEQLARLLESLPRRTTTPLPNHRANAVAALANALRYVSWELPEGVDDVKFWAWGIGRFARPDMSGYRHLVVSPFVTVGGLERFAGSPDLTVVSRSEELDRLEPSVLDGRHVYAFDPLLGYGQPAEEGPMPPDGPTEEERPEAQQLPLLRDLHAKLQVVERAKQAHVFVGSANATDGPFGGNIEVLCELIGGHSKLGVSAILDAESGIGSLLQIYAPGGLNVDNEIDQLVRRLDEMLREAAELEFVAHVAPVDEQWAVRLCTTAAFPSGAVRYEVAPLNRSVEKRSVSPGAALEVKFGPRPAADITAFYLVTAELDDKRLGARTIVVRAELSGAPSTRLDDIIARQVDTPEKFLRFVLLLLGGDPDWISRFDGLVTTGGSSTPERRISGIFELLVRTLASNPSALDDLSPLVERLYATQAGRSALPDGWDVVWNAVVDARKRLVKP